MERKIFSSISLISITISLITAIFIILLYNNFYESNIKNDLKNDIEKIKVMIYNDELSYENVNLYNNRITLIAEDGTIIFDNYYNIDNMENHNDRPEVVEAKENGYGEDIRISETINQRTYYYAEQLNDGSILRIANTSNSIYIIFIKLSPWIIIILIFIYFITLVISNIITANIIKPINDIDLDNIDDCTTYEELSPLIYKIQKQNIVINNQINDLKKKQQEFLLITDNMNEGFVVIDNNTNVLSYNKSATNIFNITNINESIFKYNRSEYFRNIIYKVLNGEYIDDIIEINSKQYQFISNFVLYDDTINGAIIFIIDVTEKNNNEKIRREFTANVSHELKTPLTSISGYAEIIKNGLVHESDVQNFAGKIYDESKRIILMINDIIKLSHLDENNINDISYEDVDLYNLADDVIKQLEPYADKSNIKIILEGNHITIHGIKQILYEIIYNLCDNAIKYNKIDGYVKIKINKIDSHTVLSVEDNGIGIADIEKDRIFERFYRVDKSHSKEITGTGLGLSIVKHGVMLHHGKIELESELRKGTKIDVIF